MSNTATVEAHNTPAESEIWTLKDVALFYRRSVSDARRKVRKAGFPPPANGDAGRCWASDVRMYAKAVRVTAPADTTVLRHTQAHTERVTRTRKVAA